MVLLLTAFTASVASAECIEIGTGTGTERYVPFYGYYNYGWSKIIYTQSELNNPCVINKIVFNVSNTPSSYTVDNQKIYMVHTTESQFSSNAKPDPSTMTLVYNGSITWDGSGWHNITLDSTFSYNNVDNLLIYYENRDGSYASGYPYWYYTSKSNRAAYKYSDGSFPETAGTLSSYVPNVRLYYTTAPKTLSSLTGVQASTDCLPPGSLNNSILRLDFGVTGCNGTLNLTEIKVMSKNTDDSDIAAGGVKAYITSTPVFSTANQFGSGASFASPATISDTYDLLPGTNHIWITYDIVLGATIGNITDAKINANDVTVNGSAYPAAEIDPAGNRPIDYPPVHNLNTDEYFYTIQAAIDDLDTVAGHTITVEPDTYNENVDVDKSLTIKSSSGNYADTIVNAADPNDHVFHVTVDYVNITGFTLSGATGGTHDGIYLDHMAHCNITNNNLTNNGYGISLAHSSNNTLNNNIASSNTKRGITLYDSSNNNTITNNIANSNPERGIRLYGSSNNILINNTASNGAGSGNGIYLEHSSNNNTLTDNTANSNWYGVYLRESNDNNLTNNTANSNDDKGIYLYQSTNNTLSGNTMSGNDRNFDIFSWDCSEYFHNIDATNFVDGKPVYYWVNEKDRQVPDDAGFVGVVNSTNITVKGSTLTNNGYGVLFACTQDSRIEQVNASDNDNGIFLLYSNNNTLTDNTANSNTDDDGIYLKSSNNNTMTNNTANANNEKGIWLGSSNNNTLTSNTASNNDDPYYGYGIFLSSDSSNNTLTDNNASNNGEDGICLYEGSNYNTLTNNTASHNDDDGIYLVGRNPPATTNNNTLTKNTVDSNGDDGIFLKDSSDNNITCNLVVHNKGNGIHLDRYYHNGKGGCIGNTIEDNNIVENGIYNSGTCGWEWNFYNEQDDNVAAENNYWGATNSAFIAAGIKEETGNVDYEPFFNDPAPCAPTPPPLEVEASIEIEKWVKFKAEPDTEYRKMVDHVNVSDNLTFKIVVRNNGMNTNLTNLSVTDLLDCCLRYVVGSANPAPDSYEDNCPDNQTLNWTFPGQWLDPGENATITFDARLNQSVDGMNYANVSAENETGYSVAEADTVKVYAANPLPCTCGDICVNPNGWWRAGTPLTATSTPIQAAINNAVAGETICVKDGTYTENVDVNERLTIKSESGYASTIVQAASPDDSVFEITTDSVNITGFTVKNATGNGKAGIYLPASGAADYSIISNNNLTNNYYGVHVYGPDYINIINNTANSNTKYGFYVRYSVYSNLTNNTANSNGERGFSLYVADYNNLTNNIANSNDEYGIYLSYSDYNNLTSNTADSNNEIGIYVPNSNHNNLINNTANSNIDHLTGTYGYGICVCYQYSDNNNLVNNTANSNGKVGIYLYGSNNNNVENNTANSDTIIGIRLYTSNENNVTNNTVSNNSRGISLESSSNDNLIYNNYFENTNNAWDDGNNVWNITKTLGTNIIGGDYLGGNYWSDYAGEDSDGDGLGDTLLPYNSSGNITTGGDWHPLVQVGAVPPSLVTYTISNHTITPPQTTEIDVKFSERVEAWINIEDLSRNLVNELYHSPGVINPTPKTWVGTYTNGTVVPDGDYYVNVTGTNTTTGESVINNTEIITVTRPVTTPNITSFAPPSPVNDTVCNWTTFNVTVNQTVNVSWYLNDSHLFTNTSITEANYTLHAEFVGENNVSAVASNANGTDMQTWIWNVTALPGLTCACGDICVNTTGWWRDGAAFNASGTPIQAAVDNATAGETICVKDGSYTENVDVNKRLTIRSENGSALTIVNASNPGDHVFEVTVNYVNVSGLTIEGATGAGGYSYAGIYLNDNIHNCTISNNTIVNNKYGIWLHKSNHNNTMTNNNVSTNTFTGISLDESCTNNRLTNNIASGNQRGIRLAHSSNNNTLTNNTANSNTHWNGIILTNSNDNVLEWNTCLDNTHGIKLDKSNRNTLEQNNCSNNYHGFEIQSSRNNTLRNNTANLNGEYGISMYREWAVDPRSNFNTLVNNNVSNNTKDGIKLDQAQYNNLTDNNVSLNKNDGISLGGSCNHNNLTGNTVNGNSRYGIWMESAHYNNLTRNTVNANSGRGIYMRGPSNNNTLYNNYFNNTNNAYDEGHNVWNITKTPGTNIIGGSWLGGNYWSDYAGKDTDGDGLGNTLLPYNSSGSITTGGDWHPLVQVGFAPPNITSFAPPSPVNDTVCTWRTFNVTVNQTVNVSWYLNNSHLFTNTSITEANYTLHAEFVGDNNVSAVAINANGTDMQTWVWNVTAPPGLTCTCGDICANTTGWWRDGAAFNASNTSIQHAIDNAAAGKTICVKDGNYDENVDADKRLTIQSENGSANCIVNASNSSKHVFNVTADYVNITGFTIENATGLTVAGVYLFGVNHCNISNNNASSSSYGIQLLQSNNNTLMGNNVSNNTNYAIYLWDSNHSQIINNTLYNNKNYGIYLRDSNNGTVTDNNVYNNSNYGIYLSSSPDSTVTGNDVYDNKNYGIYLRDSNNGTVTDNNVYNNSNYGIYLSSSSDSTVTSNEVYDNKNHGIYLWDSNNGTVTGNDVSNNTKRGIYLRNSNNNTITNNTASNNTGYDFYSDENSHDNTVKNLTIASYPTTISFTYDNGVGIKGVDTAPPDPADKVNINKYVNVTNVTANSWLFLNVSYSDADIIGVGESSLKMHRHNGTGWELADGSGINGVNPALNYVYANITEFSIFAPLGNVTGAAPPSITSFAPPSPVNDSVCIWRTFNVTVNQTVNVSWYLNNSLLHTNLATTDANYTLHAEFVGDNNVSAVATNANGADMQTWIWNVTGAPPPPSPKLCTTPDPPSHDFGIVPPGQTRSWDFEITNCGGPGTTLNWNVVASEPWISVSPSFGTNTIVTVTIDTKLPDGGVKTGTITVNSNGGTKNGVIRVNIELETAPKTGYATFATTGGYFDSVDAVAEETLPEEGKPVDMMFPHGFFSFTIEGLTSGQSVTVSIVLPSDLPANAEYWKYGPTPDNPTDHWYRFMYDGQTGAEINGNLVTLHFVDGQKGDDNPTPDGQIVDQGAPGSSPIPVPEFNAVGLLALVGILSVVLAVATLRKKEK